MLMVDMLLMFLMKVNKKQKLVNKLEIYLLLFSICLLVLQQLQEILLQGFAFLHKIT